MVVIDTDGNVSGHISILKDKGVAVVGRYFSSASWKRISKSEAAEIAAAGMKLFTIFENDGDPDLTGDDGASHAQLAVQQAKTIGQPEGSAIYFALEHLPSGYTNSDLPGIVNYIEQIRDVLAGKYKLGVYSDGVVLQALRTKKLIDFSWLSASRGFPGSLDFYKSKLWDIAQEPNIDIDWNGLSIDQNEVKDDFGQFALPVRATPAVRVAAGRQTTPACGAVPVGPVETSAQPIAISGLSDRVPLPPLSTVNVGLSSCRESTMLTKFGRPGDLTIDCSDPSPAMAKRMKTSSVGPFTVTGLNYAVESLSQIFAEVQNSLPDVYRQAKTAGMLCVRGIRHNPSHYSNHSWGTAIDLYFGKDVVPQGIRLAHRGNLVLAPVFNKYGWYWGAGFSGDAVDSMHFEMAEETILKMPGADDFVATEPPDEDLETAAAGVATPSAPVRLTDQSVRARPEDGGAMNWLQPIVESAYVSLSPRHGVSASATVRLPASSLISAGGRTMAPDGPTGWRDRIEEYRRRKAAALTTPPSPAPAERAAAPAPAATVGGNWIPLGPSVVVNGQTQGGQPVAGRVARLAIAHGGELIYAAAANGGVFRSDDGGTTWRSLMDGFDLRPTNFGSASLICGAIAIDLDDPDRIYLGSGEGDTYEFFNRQMRVIHALPAYRGVGAVRSDDGGKTWVVEPSAPDLAGEAFFALAVNPSNRESVVAGTTIGLYRRVRAGGGGFSWQRSLSGVFPSVVTVADGRATRVFAAQWGQSGQPSDVSYSDDDGQTWRPAGSSFPRAEAGRIALGVQPNNPDVIYAFIAAESSEATYGLFRLNGVGTSWSKVAGVPDVLPVDSGGNSQGGYDIAIAVDPSDANLVYLGGSYRDVDPYPASIWRCRIHSVGSGYEVQDAASIGENAHADVHSLIHSPGNSNELWCTCDGGVFLNRDPRKDGKFASQNSGLSCLCCNFIGQHPTDPNILFTGLQDNGTAYTASGAIWSNVIGGDGGYCLVNWANPDLVLAYADGYLYKSISGGKTQQDWAQKWNMNWSTMTQPIVSPPYDPPNPADASIVAVPAGQVVYISLDFAETWSTQVAIPGGDDAGLVFAARFASGNLFYLGTTTGQVFKVVLRTGGVWDLARIDNAPAGALGVTGLINDVAIDWADPTGSSIYVAFGGSGDGRHVWWFDGARWQARSGAAASALLDVEHNAMAIDRQAPNNVYVAADIGVWHSSDRGQSWNPHGNGLPEAPVFDIQIHPTQRLLRAALHGRGVFEYSIG